MLDEMQKSRNGKKARGDVLFWPVWSIAVVVSAITVFFFLAGLADGSVSADNAILWIVLLASVTGVTGGSLRLKKTRHPLAATLLALLLALPGLLAGLFFILVLLLHPRWN